MIPAQAGTAGKDCSNPVWVKTPVAGIAGNTRQPGRRWLLLMATMVFLTAFPAKNASSTCLTAECHADLAIATYIHGPIGGGMCPICHDSGRRPRASLPSSHPEVRTDSSNRVCLLCHEGIRALLERESVHTPVAEGNCVDCHDPHQAENTLFLRHGPKREKGTKRIAASCKACHEPGNQTWYDEFHAGEATLDCVVCHNAHASTEKFQLTAYVRRIYLRATLDEAAEKRLQGKLEDAISAYRKALAVKPDDVGSYLALGEIYLAQDRWTEAMKEFEQILTRQPGNLDALLGAGAAARHLAGPPAALTYLNKALELNSNRPEIHDQVGLIYLDQRQFQEALSKFSRAIEVGPDYAPAHLHLSRVLKAMGKLARAKEALKAYQKLQEN